MFKKKVLIITPKFPLPANGACEQDRLAGIMQLKRLGYDIQVVAKFFDWQNSAEIINWGSERDILIDLLPYSLFTKSWGLKLKKLINPKYWDGAAAEYFALDIQGKVKVIIESWQPDLVWVDYTYLWPLYKIIKNKNIPIITRSINFEPVHFLQEDGVNLINLFKFAPKIVSEAIAIRNSDFVFTITPKEEKIYHKLGARSISILPLRSLPQFIRHEREIKDKNILHLFFMGASYTVPHIRRGAEFVIKEIAPALEKLTAGKFVFHILGKKLPEDLRKYCVGNVKAEGFVDDLQNFLVKMDIAVIPSLFGAGMQQKIFEPLCLGIPTITSPRGLAGYPFKDKKHLLLAETKDEFVKEILKLQDVYLRQKLSGNAMALCQKIFSQAESDKIILEALSQINA